MKGNYLLLTKEQLEIFNKRYTFTITNEGILTQVSEFKRLTLHSFTDPFQAITKIDGKKFTLKITPKAISLWLEPRYNKKYTLIEVQNIINKTIINNQSLLDEDIINSLNS